MALPGEVERLGEIVLAIRRELGLSEPGGDEALVDVVFGAPGMVRAVQAVQAVPARVGESLQWARALMETIRGADADGQQTHRALHCYSLRRIFSIALPFASSSTSLSRYRTCCVSGFTISSTR